MRSRSRKMSVVLGVAATAAISGLASEVKAASYTVSNSFLLPSTSNIFTYSDGVAGSGLNANYSSTSVGVSATNPAFPQAGSQGGSPGIIGVISGTGANTSNSALSIYTGFAYDSTGFHTVGLYTSTSTPGNYGQTVSVRAINAAGQVIGSSAANSAYNSSTQSLGITAWLNNDTGPAVAIGLSTGNNGYTRALDASGDHGIYSSNTAYDISSQGYVVGTAARYDGDTTTTPSTGIGTSAWVFNPSAPNSTTGTTVEVGLIGAANAANYSYTANGNKPAYVQNVSAVNNSGEVVGTATPYSTSTVTGQSLGSDIFVYTGGANPSTYVVGAFNFTTGATSTVTATDPYNYNASSSTSYSSVTYTETMPAPVITAAGGTSFAANTFAYGQIVLASRSYLPTYYGPNTDPVANIVTRSSSPTAINDSGVIAFTSKYYINNGATGQDAFIYTPGASSPYLQVGLTTDGFTANATSFTPGTTSFVGPTGSRTSTVSFLNSANQSAGTSSMFSAYGTTQYAYAQGTAAWFATAGGTTTQIGLFNSSVGVHTSSQGAYSETVTNMTNSGLVAGFATRYLPGTTTSNGQDAWVYDSKSGTTYEVDPNDATNSSVYTSSTIDFLSENGYAAGDITGTAASGATTNQGFIWSEAYGIQFLDGSLPSSLSGTAYQDLITAYYSDLNGDTIYASTSASGLSGRSGSYPNTVLYYPSALVTLTGSPVPEPASISLIGMGSVFLLGRRRRRNV